MGKGNCCIPTDRYRKGCLFWVCNTSFCLLSGSCFFKGMKDSVFPMYELHDILYIEKGGPWSETVSVNKKKVFLKTEVTSRIQLIRGNRCAGDFWTSNDHQ